MTETYSFYANSHNEGRDNRYSEGHEFESVEDAVERARLFLIVWECGFVVIKHSRDSKVVDRVFHRAALN